MNGLPNIIPSIADRQLDESSYNLLKVRLGRSKFRSRFGLTDADRAYVARTGWETLGAQAEKIIRDKAGDLSAFPVQPELPF